MATFERERVMPFSARFSPGQAVSFGENGLFFILEDVGNGEHRGFDLKKVELIQGAKWEFAHRKDKRNKKSYGKWLLFGPTPEQWYALVYAMEYEDKEKLIVSLKHTYDLIVVYTGKGKIMEVREMLRAMGIVKKIPYKPDEWTREGRSGSLYYE